MPNLAQSTGYAILALGFIASAAGKPLLTRTIAEKCGLPAPFLSKIVNRLARGHLVITQRGVNGGVMLSRPANEITLYEVCSALDDPILVKRCMLGIATCSDAQACPAHEFNTKQRNQIIDYLNSTTIADIASFELMRRWDTTSPESSNPVGQILPPPPAEQDES